MFYCTEREKKIGQITPVLGGLHSTVMFDLSKSFSQLYLAIYGEKLIFSSRITLKWFENAKKSEKTAQNLNHYFGRAKSNSTFFYKGIRF